MPFQSTLVHHVVWKYIPRVYQPGSILRHIGQHATILVVSQSAQSTKEHDAHEKRVAGQAW